MRNGLLLAVLITAAALCASQAFGDRLILTPTGNLLDQGEVRAEAAFGSPDAPTGLLTAGASERVYWANIGMGRIEIEGARFEPEGGESLDILSAEVAVLPETLVTPAIGLGVRDITEETTDGRGYYVAITKTVPLTDVVPFFLHDVKVHAGYGVDGLNGAFGGVQVGLPLKLTLYAEHDSENFNAALSWNIVPLVGLKVYSLDGEVFYGASFKMKL